MSISRLYDYLERKDFLDPATGQIFFPVYLYTYSARDEYAVRGEIQDLAKRLERPLAMVETLILNLYDVLIDYLKSDGLRGTTNFDLILQQEDTNPVLASKRLERLINKDAFVDFLNNIIIRHLSVDSDKKRVYIFLHGVGSVFPYLRTSKLITRMEKYIGQKYKLIIFYPGSFEAAHYHLFGIMPGSHIYRANHLNPLI
jgi:hypothetical protein